MSSLRTGPLFNTKAEIAICGYIRENFDKKCWIDEIIATIIKFYLIKGKWRIGLGYGRLGIAKYENKTCKDLTLCPPFTNNNAYKVSVSEGHTLVIDTEGGVWCNGAGAFGQLGNGKTDNLYVPTKLNLAIRVIAVSAGGCHSLFLCEDGTVKGCGSNIDGQIGLGYSRKILVPKTNEALKKYKVIQVNAGSYHSAALTEDGYLFCFGENIYGQCGVGQDKGKCIVTPTKVDLDDEIQFVDCGHFHTLIITRKGLIYSFGEGRHGKLGHGTEENEYVPTSVGALKDKKMKVCAGGEYHSLCIDKEGIIWTFGRNHRGQCGLSEGIKKQTTPKMILKNNIKAKECYAGGYSSSVIATDGCLYLFGCNIDYEMGLEEKKDYFTPTKVSIAKIMTVQSISMGLYHTAIICDAM